MKAMGLSKDTFAPAIWDAVQADGKQYAVPLDTHPIVLYYNKDKLAAAGLIGDNGLPKDLNGVDNFNAALKKLQDGGTKWAMSTYTAAGDFQFRTIYSLLCQLDGQMLTGDEVARRRQQGQADQGADESCPTGSRTATCPPTPNIRRRSRCSPRVNRRCISTASGKCRPSPTSPSRTSSASNGARSSCRCSSTTPAPIRTRIPSRSPTMPARR